MKKLISMMMVAAVTLVLASCGGGTGSGPLTGGSGGGTTTPPPPPTQYNLTVLTSSPQMPSDGSKSPTITALVRDTNNNVVSGVPVSFQASSGALTVTTGTTDASGTATATLSTAGDPTDRDIKVTAAAGASTATVDVSVVGTKLSLSGPSSMVQGDTQPYTVSLVDSAGTGISDQTVSVASAKDNTLNPSTFTTSTSGQGTFTVNAINSGTDTLTASAAGLQATESVDVSSDSFTFTQPAANTNIDIGSGPVTIKVVWKTSNNPVVGKTVNFSATRGTLSSATAVTQADGSATVTITSATAGPSVISANSSGVSSQLTINFIATTPNSISLQASPTTVATQAQSTITATVRDATSNLVDGQTVDFTLQDSTGGTLSAASAVTNAQGQASVTYTASATTSATNGVVITGTLPGTAITPATTSLTVSGETVFLSLGTGNKITEYSATQYELPYTVQAVDSSGNGVNGVTVTFSVVSLGYIKGVLKWTAADSYWDVVSSEDANFATDSSPPYNDAALIAGLDACISEDADNDGIEDDDYNGDFGKKTPGQPVIYPGQVASTDVGSGITASGGTAAVNLIYPKDHSYWVAVRLTATATVQGNQSSTSVDFWLPGAAGDYNQQTTQPPGPFSPYGVGTTCSDPN